MPGRVKPRVTPAPATEEPAPGELSREADEASAAGLSEATAELVGWVGRAGRGRSDPLVLPSPRSVLAAALGVPEAVLEQMGDAEVASALTRLRSLVDQCLRLTDHATLDELTGAMRRGVGLAALQREMARTLRLAGKGLAVIFLDVDGLKKVNDTEGHSAGDRLLRDTVATLRERLRSYDLIVRYGGDEFLCVLTDSTTADAARTAAALCQHVKARTGGSVSAGVAVFEPGESVESLVGRADAALYDARREQGHPSGSSRDQ